MGGCHGFNEGFLSLNPGDRSQFVDLFSLVKHFHNHYVVSLLLKKVPWSRLTTNKESIFEQSLIKLRQPK